MLFKLSELKKKTRAELIAIAICLDKALELACEDIVKIEEENEK